MNRPVVLDASVLIAAMQPSDAHHMASQRILRTGAVVGGLLAHWATIAESAVGACRAGYALRVRDAYAALGIVSPPQDEDGAWRAAQLRADTGLTLLDALVLDTALQSDATLATFDQRLAATAVAKGVQVLAYDSAG